MIYIKERKEKINGVTYVYEDIYLTRGDSAYLDFPLTDKDGNPIVLGDGDHLRCQVRKEPNGGEVLFEGIIEEGETYTWHIVPSDTKDAPLDTYVWDAQVEYSNGDIFTFVNVSNFTILKEVTDEETETEPEEIGGDDNG